MRALGLHQITAAEVDTFELASIASELRCQDICIFTNVPPMAGVPGFRMLTPSRSGEMARHLAELGIGVATIEYFPLSANTNLDSYRTGLEVGAACGAKRAAVHIHDPEPGRALDILGRFAGHAAEFHIDVGLEFMGLTPACGSLAHAQWFIEQLALPHIGIAVDALHLVRTGASPADLALLPGHVFSYAQMCDGYGLHSATDYLAEALDRENPGQGDFPLQSFAAWLPADIPVDVEVPSASREKAGILPLERARAAVTAARRLLEPLSAERSQ
jgi:sugar phosphate isomerase/epimerase